MSINQPIHQLISPITLVKQTISLSTKQPINQSANQPIHPRTHQTFTHPSIHPSTEPSAHPPIHPPIHPSIHPTSIHPYIQPRIQPPTHPLTRPYIQPPAHLYIHPHTRPSTHTSSRPPIQSPTPVKKSKWPTETMPSHFQDDQSPDHRTNQSINQSLIGTTFPPPTLPVLQVTDTPGLCKTHRSDDLIYKEVGKGVAVASPGPHVFIFTTRCDRRFTGVSQFWPSA